MDKYVIAPPQGSTNNSVGASDRKWKEGHFESLPNWQEYLAESTGYGIVSGCETTISGLTVTVGAGVAHLANGTRKEIAQTNITLDNADSTNPRIDLVYINADGEVAKVTGTAAASPSAPDVPTGGISVCNVTIAAEATVGVVDDVRKNVTLINTTSHYGMTGDTSTNKYNKFVDMLNKNSFIIIDEPVLIDGEQINASDKIIICVGRGKVYTQNGIIISGDNNKISVTLEFSNHKGLYVSGNNNLLENCIVYRTEKATYPATQYNNGCLAISGINNKIYGGEVYNGGFGIRISSGSSQSVECAYIHDTFTGILVGSSIDSILRNNTIININMGSSDGADGILVKDPSRRIKIIENRIDTIIEHGMYVQSSDSIVDNNIVSNCTSCGIKLASYEDTESGFYNENSIVSHNVCYGNGDTDVYLQNTCINTLVDGNILLSGNEISIHAVKVSNMEYTPNKKITVINNKCISKISIASEGNIVISNNISTGIEKSSSYENDFTRISDNVCSSSIYVAKSNKSVVTGNKCKAITFNSGTNTVTDNYIELEKDYIINYINDFSRNTIETSGFVIKQSLNYTNLKRFCDNIFYCSGSPSSAWVTNPTSGTLKGCIFSGNRFSGCGSVSALNIYGDYNLGVNNISDSTNSAPINIRGNNSVVANNITIPNE